MHSVKHTAVQKVITLLNPSLNIILSRYYKEPVYEDCYANKSNDGISNGTHTLITSADKSKQSLTVFIKMVIISYVQSPSLSLFSGLLCVPEADLYGWQSKSLCFQLVPLGLWQRKVPASYGRERGVGLHSLFPHLLSQVSAGTATRFKANSFGGPSINFSSSALVLEARGWERLTLVFSRLLSVSLHLSINHFVHSEIFLFTPFERATCFLQEPDWQSDNCVSSKNPLCAVPLFKKIENTSSQVLTLIIRQRV